MRQKTSMPQEVSFNQKITKAIHHKKTLINNMALTRQRPQHAHSYRLSPFASGKTQHGLKTQQDLTPSRQGRTVQVSEQMARDYLEDHDIGAGVCGSHPSKRAAFEDKQQREDLYCHECAIRMVKQDRKVVGLTHQSLMLKSLLQRQLDQIEQEETQVRQLVEDYYQGLKQTFETIYLEFLEQRVYQSEIVHFGEFRQGQLQIDNIKQCLGSIEDLKFKFVVQGDKENKAWETNLGGTPGKVQTQPGSIQLPLESNRSLEAASHRGQGKTVRSRQNSDFHRGQHPPESRKVLNLR